MTEDEFDKLARARRRVPKQQRLVAVWERRLEEAQRMVAQLKGELTDVEAEAESLGVTAGLTAE